MAVTAKRFANALPNTARARPLRALFLAVAASALPFGAFGGAVPHATPEDVGLSSERLQQVTEVVRRHIEAGDVSGAVTLVARRGHIAHFEAQGFLDIESQTPLGTDAIFRLASMSKPITAVAIMMLVEQGEIRLDDPVSRFIPGFADSNKVAVPRPGGEQGQYDLVTATRPITIRDLLTHAARHRAAARLRPAAHWPTARLPCCLRPAA